MNVLIALLAFLLSLLPKWVRLKYHLSVSMVSKLSITSSIGILGRAILELMRREQFNVSFEPL